MKNKFEVGDVVRAEGSTGHRVGTVEYRDDDPEQVYIYHVRYDNEGCETKEFSMKWHKPEELTLVSGSFDEDVELVEAIEHTGKFKRGDHVRVVSAVLPAHVESIGKEGKIKGVWLDGLYRYKVQFNDGDVTLRSFNEVQLELIDEGFKFSVGDKVRVVKDDTLLPNEKEFNGTVGEIAKVDTSRKDKYPYAVDLPEMDRYLWVEEDALEIVNENTSSEQSVEHLALDYLLSQGGSPIKVELMNELVEWTKRHLEEWNFKEVRKTLNIAERLMDANSKDE